MLLRPFLLRRTLHTTTRLSSTTTTARLPPPFSIRTYPLLFTSAALGFSLPFFAPRSSALLDTAFSTSSAPYTNSRDTKTPFAKDSKSLNPAVVKQISLGSILGLGAGVLVSAFSRTLTLLLGVGIVIVQYAARSGYNIIPVERVQRYVKGINLRSAILDNAAFKLSFGLTFALAAFGGF
ncbi:hypothetical protein GJ744_000097 [Endocarpon pusillum]|uniref:Fun14 family protein n=1 Tax=Endocarpon pusillum TaxID=364733 RepID=A0A8H7AWT1_9EURO|nr:hypothetical protein GJ744_000097 [Endocarpon pusillum]